MLPRIEPILPVLARDVPRGRAWTYELKLDGFRGTLYIEAGRGRFLSKTKKPLTRFDDLANALARAVAVKDAIFDGEIIVMGNVGPDFLRPAIPLHQHRRWPSNGSRALLYVYALPWTVAEVKEMSRRTPSAIPETRLDIAQRALRAHPVHSADMAAPQTPRGRRTNVRAFPGARKTEPPQPRRIITLGPACSPNSPGSRQATTLRALLARSSDTCGGGVSSASVSTGSGSRTRIPPETRSRRADSAFRRSCRRGLI